MEVTEACSSRNRSNRTPLGDIKGFVVSVVFSYFCVYVCYVLTHFSLQSGGMRTLEKLFELVTSDCFLLILCCVYIFNTDSVSMLLQLAGRLSGKLLLEAAKYQVKKEVIKKVHIESFFC